MKPQFMLALFYAVSQKNDTDVDYTITSMHVNRFW